MLYFTRILLDMSVSLFDTSHECLSYFQALAWMIMGGRGCRQDGKIISMNSGEQNLRPCFC